MKLYEISKQYEILLEQYYECETLESEEALLAQLNEVANLRDEKLAACCGWYKNLEAELQAVKDHSKYLKERKSHLEKKIENFEKYIKANLPDGAWSNGLHKLSIRKSVQTIVDNFSELPIQFIVTKTEQVPDKNAIKEAILNKEKVPGARLETFNNLVVK